ncbi:MAG TPA: NUDIX hydrolase [Patescibacteria group bacterium]
MKTIRPLSNQPLPHNAKKVFEGVLFSVYQWEQEMFDGTKEVFEKIARRDTVGVIAVTKNKKILISFQEQPSMKPFIGTPGGIIDAGEEPFDAVQRELLEETGYKSEKWELFDSVQPTTKIDWAIFIFIARDCVKIQEPRLDAGEKMEIKELSWDEFLEIINKDEFRDKELALKILRMQAVGQIETLKQQLLG